jgi:3-hydroxyacyl-[acyl-carrier-protein] dehydratase
MNAHSRTFEFQFSIGSEHPALPGHFPEHPIVPGVLVLDRVLTRVTTELNRPVSILKKVKFAAALLPDETAMVVCEATGDKLRFSVRARRAHILVMLVTGSASLSSQTTPPASAAPARGSSLG